MTQIEKTKTTIYKADVYFVDIGDNYKSFKELLSNIRIYGDASIITFSEDSAPVMWHDDIDINLSGTTQDVYEKYFNVTPMTHEQIENELGHKIEIIE